METRIKINKPIPITENFSWKKVKKKKIKENDEKLISLNMIPEKIIVRSQYFIQGIKGALPESYVRESVYDKLIEATNYLPNGYKLLIYDAWRPEIVQYELYESFKKELQSQKPDLNEDEIEDRVEEYVALPSNKKDCPSPHLTGGAVDLTVIDANGKVLDMGTGFDETIDATHTDYYERMKGKRKLTNEEEKVLKNRRLLYNTMLLAGFSNYPHEWWHFDYGNQLWAYMLNKKNALYNAAAPKLRWKHSYR